MVIITVLEMTCRSWTNGSHLQTFRSGLRKNKNPSINSYRSFRLFRSGHLVHSFIRVFRFLWVISFNFDRILLGRTLVWFFSTFNRIISREYWRPCANVQRSCGNENLYSLLFIDHFLSLFYEDDNRDFFETISISDVATRSMTVLFLMERRGEGAEPPRYNFEVPTLNLLNRYPWVHWF